LQDYAQVQYKRLNKLFGNFRKNSHRVKGNKKKIALKTEVQEAVKEDQMGGTCSTNGEIISISPLDLTLSNPHTTHYFL